MSRQLKIIKCCLGYTFTFHALSAVPTFERKIKLCCKQKSYDIQPGSLLEGRECHPRQLLPRKTLLPNKTETKIERIIKTIPYYF